MNTAIEGSSFSETELIQAAEALGQADSNISAIAVAPDSSGLVVEVPAAMVSKKNASKNAAADSRTSAETPTAATLASRFNARYVAGLPATPAVARRQDDSSAAPGWKGGSRTLTTKSNGSVGACSTGFSVTRGGLPRLLTAAHCNQANGQSVRDGNNNSIGTVELRTVSTDSELITASAASNRVYVGAWNNTSGTYRSVISRVGSANGSYVCTSGSATGTNCDIKIVNKNYRYSLEDGIARWGALATRQGAVRAVGKGDSGGPVIKNTNPSGSRVKAAGIISGLKTGTEIPCGQGGVSWDSSVTNTCARSVIYVKIADALSSGVVLKTS